MAAVHRKGETEGRNCMLCHMIIDLSVLLCAGSDGGTKLAQR